MTQVKFKFDPVALPAQAEGVDRINKHLFPHVVITRERTQATSSGLWWCTVAFETIPEPAISGLVTALNAMAWFSDAEIV